MSEDMGDNFLEQLEDQGALKESYVIPKRKLDESSPPETEDANDAKRPKLSENPVSVQRTAKEIHELLYNDQIPPDLVAQCTMRKCGLCQKELAMPSISTSHYFGKPHLKTLADQMIKRGLQRPVKQTDKAFQTSGLSEDKQDLKYCHVCKINLSSEVTALQHYDGKNHANRQRMLLNPDGTFSDDDEDAEDKPPQSLAELITMSIESTEEKKMRMYNICEFIKEQFPYYKRKNKNWPRSIRLELANNHHFFKILPPNDGQVNQEGIQIPPNDGLVKQDTDPIPPNDGQATQEGVPTQERRVKREGVLWRLATSEEIQARIEAEKNAPIKTEADAGPIRAKNGKSKNTGFYCLPCGTKFSNGEEYTEHASSAEHEAKCAESPTPQTAGVDQLLNRIRNNPQTPYECTVCNIRTTGEDNFKMHMEGSKHKKKLQLAANGPSVNQPKPVVVQGGKQPIGAQPMFRCDVCQIFTTDQSTLDGHMIGKKHAKKLENVKIFNSA